MTYTDIMADKISRDKLPKNQRIALAIIYELYNRKGFDDWWDNIDDDIKDELFETISREIN